jgi:broad specificity phosphatase PhoE
MKLNNKYYILRHGQAISNVKNIVSSWPEKFKNSLTKEGKEAIKQVAINLKNKNIDLIFSSDLLRTEQTAEIVGKVLKVKPKFDKRLREINFGVLNSKSAEEFTGYFKGLSERIKGKVEGGENYTEVSERVYEFLKEINKKYKSKNILIVSHQAPLLLLRAKVKDVSVMESIKKLEKILSERRITKGELIELN